MSQITGRAHIRGTTGATATYDGVAEIVQDFATDVEIGGEADVNELRDGNNDLAAYEISSRRKTCSITFIPVATGVTNTKAEAAKKLELPEVPSIVTLAGMLVTAYNGDWIYKGGARMSRSGAEARLTIPLERPEDLADGVTLASLATEVA
jgi:hypothetical protein